MIDQIAALIVDEGKWLPVSMAVALVAVAVLLSRHPDAPVRTRVLAAMSLFFAVTIGMMAFGHLLAVTTKLALGTLRGPTALLYLIGVALSVPSWWLAHHTRIGLGSGDVHGRTTLALNGWLAVTLLALGVHNVPLAVPGLLNIGYQLHSGRWGWAIAGVSVIVNAGLFVGSLIFMASGQSFEQFSGMG
jgi:hypothetical protein